MDWYKIYILFVLGMSLFTLLVYMIDKRKAIKNRWRIKESVLLSCSFFGGALGGLLGLYLVRHKTKHWYFVANTILTTLVHIGLLVFVIVA